MCRPFLHGVVPWSMGELRGPWCMPARQQLMNSVGVGAHVQILSTPLHPIKRTNLSCTGTRPRAVLYSYKIFIEQGAAREICVV